MVAVQCCAVLYEYSVSVHYMYMYMYCTVGAPNFADARFAAGAEVRRVDSDHVVAGGAALPPARRHQEVLLAVFALQVHEVRRVHALVDALPVANHFTPAHETI